MSSRFDIVIALCSLLTVAGSQGAAAWASSQVEASLGSGPRFGNLPRVHVMEWESAAAVNESFGKVMASGGTDAVHELIQTNAAARGRARGYVGELVVAKIFGRADMGRFRHVARRNSPQNDFWSVELGQGIQAKVRKDPSLYAADMRRDNLAEAFVVPDDHVEHVRNHWMREYESAVKRGDRKAAAEALRQRSRVFGIGRTFSWIDSRVVPPSAQGSIKTVAGQAAKFANPATKVLVRHGATAALVIGGGAIVGSAEAAIAFAQYATGDISGSELNDQLLHAGVQCAAGSAVSAAVLIATPAAPVLVVIAIGFGTALAADVLIEEFLAAQGLADETAQLLDRPIEPLDLDEILGGSSGVGIIRRPGHVSLEELVAPVPERPAPVASP